MCSSRIRRFDLPPEIPIRAGKLGSPGATRASRSAYSSAVADISGIAAEADERQQGIAIVGMARQDVLQNGHGLVAPSGRMQRDGIDIGVSRPVGLELGGAAKLAERLIGPFEPGERQAERMMQSRILRRCGDRRAQHALALASRPSCR